MRARKAQEVAPSPDLSTLLNELGARLNYTAPELAQLTAVTQQTGSTKAADLRRALQFIDAQESSNNHAMLRFEIPGDPVVSKRPRHTTLRNGAGAPVGMRVYAGDAGDQRTLRREFINQLPEGHVPYAGEVHIGLDIYRKILTTWPPYKCLLAECGYIRPATKPDIDNCAKIVIDAMRSVVFVDDSQLVACHINLHYSVRPRTVVEIHSRPLAFKL